MKYSFRAFIFLSVILLSACAVPMTVGPQGSRAEIRAEAEKQKEFVRQMEVNRWYKDSRRLERVMYPILRNNVKLCGRRVVYDYGIRVWSSSTWPSEYYYTIDKLYGLDRAVNIYLTVSGSPAAKAGINRGDKILAVNGVNLFEGKDVLSRYKSISRKRKGKSTLFTIERKGKIFNYKIKAHKRCNYKVVYRLGDKTINAYSDGKKVYATQGMMDFARSDNELALVMSHELGHNIMKHQDKKKTNILMAGLLGAVIDVAVMSAGGASVNATGDFMRMGNSAYSVQFEQEADYVGLYVMRRAGYNIDNAENLWRRMSAEVNKKGISIRTTHPANAERYVALNKTVAEIKSKERRGIELLPNLGKNNKKKTLEKKRNKDLKKTLKKTLKKL